MSSRTVLVTVTYNSERHIPGFIRSLLAQSTQDFLLVVVDNASSDATLAVLGRELKAAKFGWLLVKNDKNVGVAAANNMGVRAGREQGVRDWAIIINNDVTFGPDLVATLTHREPGYRIVSPLILDRDSDRIWYAGGRFARNRMMSTAHEKFGEPISHIGKEGSWETEYAPTTCLAMPLGAFDEDRVGAFFEPYFCYYDDADWVYRSRQKGYRVFIDGDTVLRHFEGGASGGNRSAFSLYYLTRNRLIFVRRSLGRLAFVLGSLALLIFVLASAVRERSVLFYLRHRLRGWWAGVTYSGAAA